MTVVSPTIITDNKRTDFMDATESYMKKLTELALRNIDKEEEKLVNKDQRLQMRKISMELQKVTPDYTITFFNNILLAKSRKDLEDRRAFRDLFPID